MTSAGAAGTSAIGGDLTVNRMGFGAMRITGPGIWGPPQDRDEAISDENIAATELELSPQDVEARGGAVSEGRAVGGVR